MPVDPLIADRTAFPVQGPTTPVSGPLATSVPAWPFALLAGLIMCRAVVYLSAAVAGQWVARPGTLHLTWVQLLQGSFYAIAAGLLMVFGRHDRRAWGLGAFLGGIACALMDSFLASPTNPLLNAAKGLRTDAFFAATLWFFCAAFPGLSRRSWLSAAFGAGLAVSSVLGVTLAGFDAIATFQPGVPEWLASLAANAARHSRGAVDWYFSLQFLSMLPLLVLMPLKSSEAGADDRRRYRWLTLGISIALGPLVIDVFATTFWPGLHEWTRGTVLWPLRSIAIMSALTVLPVASAYSALVHRTVDIGFALRAAARYLVARYAAHSLAAAPIAVALLVVFANRDRSVVELAAGPVGATLAAVSVVAWAAAAGRHRLLDLIDARYFRQAVDAQATFLSLSDALRKADSIETLAAKAQAAIDGAFHPAALAICVEDSAGLFVPQNVDAPAVSKASALAQIIGGNDRPLSVTAIGPGVLERLPAADRAWLDETKAVVLVPLRSSQGDLLGVAAVGERRSEMPYGAHDVRLLAALGSACGLGIERLQRMAQARDSGGLPAAGLARECVECGQVSGGEALACTCGAPLQRAPVPHVLNDRLRIIRRIGAGGFAVVYSAVDLALKQPRAVKALPQADPAHFARLRREARLMSTVQHPHLATVYALEAWGLWPMLVMELLEGGTLSDRLRRGALPVDEVVAVGRKLADALCALHRNGVLHRDVKPSNIGFTTEGTPKLLDFGLAKMLEVRGAPAAAHSSESTWSGLPNSEKSGVFRGTPAYASPEALLGEPPSPADDIWSLGVTLLEAATGTNPFRAATPAAVSARVLADDGRVQQWLELLPPPAREPFASLLTRDPVRRAASGRALVQILDDVPVNGSDVMTTQERSA